MTYYSLFTSISPIFLRLGLMQLFITIPAALLHLQSDSMFSPIDLWLCACRSVEVLVNILHKCHWLSAELRVTLDDVSIGPLIIHTWCAVTTCQRQTHRKTNRQQYVWCECNQHKKYIYPSIGMVLIARGSPSVFCGLRLICRDVLELACVRHDLIYVSSPSNLCDCDM
jgi:hypothetical protein